MRVWMTRDEPPDGPLSTALQRVALTVVYEPVLERRVVPGEMESLSSLEATDWLVLTSPYAIEAIPAEWGRIPRVAVVGEPSREAAVRRGFRVELVSAGGTGESLFSALREQVRSGRIWYPRSSLADPPVAWPGVELLSPVLYETATRVFDQSVIQRADVAALASPSAVRAIGPAPLPLASIGPSTSAAIREMGKEPWVEAPQPSFESLAQAIADHAHS